MATNKKSPQEIALAVQGEAKTLVPALFQALRELDETKKHEVLLEVFRRVDSKQNELEVFQKAYSEVVVKQTVVGSIDGKDVVKREITKSRNIGHLVRTLGRKEVAEIIRLLLVNVNNYFNVKESLNTYQVDEIAEQIIDEYGDRLFMDELVYIFKKAKTTAQLYNAIDGAVIFRWIDAHYKMKEQCQMKKDVEYKSAGFELPKLPKGMLSQAVEKMQQKYIDNMIDVSQVPKPESEKKKKKK